MVTAKRGSLDRMKLRAQRRGRGSANAERNQAYGRAGEQSLAFARFSGFPYAIWWRIVASSAKSYQQKLISAPDENGHQATDRRETLQIRYPSCTLNPFYRCRICTQSCRLAAGRSRCRLAPWRRSTELRASQAQS